VEINIFDPDYVQKMQVASLQTQADAQNALHLQLYQQACSDWINTNSINRDRSLAITPAPAKPQKQVVSDTGVTTLVDWTELQTPVLPALVLAPSTALKATVTTPDRIDQIIAALGVLNGKLDKIAAKLEA
jgi:hypothetical protein